MLNTNTKKEQTFYNACRKNNSIQIEIILNNGFQPNFLYFGDKTPLIIACENENLNYQTIKILLENGADPNRFCKFNRNALITVLKNKHITIEIIQLFLQHGADLTLKNSYDKTPIEYALENASLEVIKFLVEKGKIDLGFQDKYGRTAFSFLCGSKKPNLDLIIYLIGKGANLLQTNVLGKSPLNKFLENQTVSIEEIKYVLEQVSDPNILLVMCKNERISAELIAFLINTKKFDINFKDIQGRTALIYLCQHEKPNIELIQLFIEHGADASVKDISGKSCLDYALKNKNFKRETIAKLDLM